MEKLCKSEIYDECCWGGEQPRLGSGRVLGGSPSRGNILDVKGGLSLKGRGATGGRFLGLSVGDLGIGAAGGEADFL